MSFRLTIHSVEDLGGETRIRGRLLSGAFFGPQSIRLQDITGKQRTVDIIGVEMFNTQSWPVTAHHDAQLDLYIATPNPAFTIDINTPVESLGSVVQRQDSIDLSKELSNPLFWANFSVLHMHSEEIDDPSEVFFPGLSGNEVGKYYTDFLRPLIDSETWPIFLLEIDSDRYAEVEWAGGAEYQNRVWIGSRASRNRALLGYYSGHFSLPGLRQSELIWLLDRLEQTSSRQASGLLLVPMCYLPEPDTQLIERLAGLCARIPGAEKELAGMMAANLIEHQVVPEAIWEHQTGFGWCSNWDYSQRNPESLMSVLSEADFEFIELFFRDET